MKKLPVSMTANEKILGWCYWGIQLLVLPAVLSLVLPFFSPDLSPAEMNFIFLALNFLCMSAIMFRFLGQSFRQGLQRPFYLLQSAFLAYGLYWAGFLLIQLMVSFLKPGFFNVNDDSISQLLGQNYILTAIGVILLAPVTEELFYRALIFGSLHRRSRFAAYAVSCIAFSAVHVVGYLGQWDALTLLLCFLQYLPAGACLAWAYERSGSIWAPILMHIAVNQTGILSMR